MQKVILGLDPVKFRAKVMQNPIEDENYSNRTEEDTLAIMMLAHRFSRRPPISGIIITHNTILTMALALRMEPEKGDQLSTPVETSQTSRSARNRESLYPVLSARSENRNVIVRPLVNIVHTVVYRNCVHRISRENHCLLV